METSDHNRIFVQGCDLLMKSDHTPTYISVYEMIQK